MPSKVLIVEDDSTTRVGLAELLEGAGYEATAVGTFEEGQHILRTSPPDLLIADVRLGPYNGLQLVISSPIPIPSIIITGFADPVLEADAKRRGADYIVKPVDPAVLLALIEQKLQTARTGFGVPRRWERKQVIGGLPAQVENAPARVVDISYGGLRFEIPRQADQSPPRSFHLTLPSASLSVKAHLVWKSLIADQTWLCGAALSPDSASPAWQGLVDALT
ncbi:MAG TPA: response regulator [Vicinamibacterales bacterium]|nr:response regulator [Vicinamibacterales bacterium]